jgi:DNA-binding XRE family transcriptional regulator
MKKTPVAKPVPPRTPPVAAADRKQARARGEEWKQFRRDFLFSQNALADHLRCSRRTVSAIESGREVINPHLDLLRRFRDFKRKQQRLQEGEVA